jgi:hypothetical protein
VQNVIAADHVVLDLGNPPDVLTDNVFVNIVPSSSTISERRRNFQDMSTSSPYLPGIYRRYADAEVPLTALNLPRGNRVIWKDSPPTSNVSLIMQYGIASVGFDFLSLFAFAIRLVISRGSFHNSTNFSLNVLGFDLSLISGIEKE